jgi:hypothetical protein
VLKEKWMDSNYLAKTGTYQRNQEIGAMTWMTKYPLGGEDAGV